MLILVIIACMSIWVCLFRLVHIQYTVAGSIHLGKKNKKSASYA
jgi:hypothetical protein